MKPREYCCCAIPLVNAGIYSVLSEQFVCGAVVGIVSMTTSSIVGAATPSFAPYFLGVVALVAAGVQVFGFVAVKKENTSAFKKYLTLHTIITIVAFAIAAAWIIISAIPSPPRVDIGLMGGLWAVLGIAHLYFYFVLLAYAPSVQETKYAALNDPTNENYPMTSRADPWDSRPSTDTVVYMPVIHNQADAVQHDPGKGTSQYVEHAADYNSNNNPVGRDYSYRRA
ncbi:hypothetical protein FISHEDRAFT_66473 [Fistulina hepatica ATCC 64428]|uniref:Uncharacterized protein n=1 Tax=Fistulina hepatica ATCC 64428 TaxID=1128425 RepID=A0A0D7A6M7_9AGAR|nr:hypothetical protein FISHEDRAFT_66473 [Fistulina hepatica ATCC 64428]